MARQCYVGLGLLIIVAWRSHSGHEDTSHWVVLLWTGDRPVAENFHDITQHPHEKDIHALTGFEPAVPESVLPRTHALDRAATVIV